MLSSIRVKNFKAFADSGVIDLKPITLFCGTNSCGKSTMLQSLLLWKQTIESKNFDQSILMNGRLIHLGTISNALHGHKNDAPLTFEYTYSFSKKDYYSVQKGRFRYPFEFFMRDFFHLKEGLDEKDFIYHFFYSVTLEAIQEDNTELTRTVKPVRITLRTSATTPENEGIEGATVELSQRKGTNEYDLTWENILSRHGMNEMPKNGKAKIGALELINFVPTEMRMARKKDEPLFHECLILFYRFAEMLRLFYGSLTYLGPLREEPARRYIYEDEVVEIGVKGENAAYIYLKEGPNLVKNHFFYSPLSDSFVKEESVSLKASVDRWFQIMGIHSFVANSESEIIRLLLNSSKYSSTSVNIADVGFGVSQIFPIILEGLRMSSGQTLLLEQPEIHLHPRLQMQLADYIVSLALSGKKVILETHSDHIVNRLVRRMVEDSSGATARMMGIYFVSQSNEGSKIEDVALSPEVGIKNWPDDFFDQSAIEQQLIMKALIKNQMRG